MSLERMAVEKGKRHWRRRWYGVCAVLCTLAILATTYALMLDARTEDRPVFCGREEHSHGAECYQLEYTCGFDQMAHAHSESCTVTDTVLMCGETGHSHGETCYAVQKVLTCASEEEAHTHGEACYTDATELVCVLPEEEHTHEDTCYESRTVYVCGLAEVHIHTDVCYRESQTPCCSLTEGENHTHEASCYEIRRELICDLNAFHAHNELCEVRKVNCSVAEHTHSLICYSDSSADVEWRETWERNLPKLSGEKIADLVLIASTQLGYRESEKNYVLDGSGVPKGYTRYGQWYGDMYGDWCAMFVSFCLRYAGYTEVPIHSNCQRWIEKLTEAGLYVPQGMYVPAQGDVIFFDLDGDATADHVGLVRDYDGEILTIEGNSGNAVQARRYSRDDSTVMGYATVSKLDGAPVKKGLEGNYQEVVDASNFTKLAGDSATTHIRLTANLTITSGTTLPSNKNLTIDLNGYVLTHSGSSAMFTVGSGRTLTVWDSRQPNETITMAEYDPANRKEYPGTFSGKTVTYYVMTTKVVDPAIGTTQEEVQQHTFTAAGGIKAGSQPIVSLSGGTFNLEGGMIYDGTKRAVSITSGTANLNGGYICGFDLSYSGTVNATNQFGGAVYMTGGTVNVMGAVLAANTAGSAGAIYATGGTINLGSNGERVGIIAGNQALSARDVGSGKGYNGGGGVYIKNATMNMTAGYVTNNVVANYTGKGANENGGDYSGGGGIMLEGSSKMDFCGGYITGNWADGGGGIRTTLKETNYVTMYCVTDEMGEVISAPFLTANVVRAAEGGGMSLGMGEEGVTTGATITGGYVTNNTILATIHWGGGGLFCAEHSVLHIENALITENTAGGLGGGMAGCSTGHIFVHTTQGCAIYDNEDIIHREIQYASSDKPDNELIEENPEFLNYGHSDYFCALESEMSGEMLGGGAANWEGTADGKAITVGRYDVASAQVLMGLKSHASEEDKLAAQAVAMLYINGNHSFTHGGGIMCNGIMSVGALEPMYVPVSFEPDAIKKLVDMDGNELSMDGYQFQFSLTDPLGNEISHGTTDATGHIVFDRSLILRSIGTETFYIKELRDEAYPNILTDTTYYRLQTTTSSHKEDKLDDNTKKITLKLSSFVLDKLNAEGEWETVYSESGKSYIDSIQLRIFGDSPVFTNVLAESTDIQVQKVWKDGSTQAVTVRLYRDDELIDTQTLNSANSWSYVWPDMPMGDGTRKYDYRVEEDTVAGYVAEYYSEYSIVGGTYWVPAQALSLGGEYLITNSGGNYAMMLTQANANNTLTTSNRVAVTRKSGTLTVNGATYSTWYEGDMASDRVFVAEATGDGAYLTLKNKAIDSWLATISTSSGFWNKTYNLQGRTNKSNGSAFFINSGVLQGTNGNSYTGSDRYSVIYSSNKFGAANSTSNAASVYKKVELTKGLSFTIVNTPVASTKYEINVEKVSEKDGRGLVGAKFQVLDSNGNALRFTTDGDGIYTLSTANSAVSEPVTSTGGRMILTGLSAGSYILRETEAPVGHLPIEDYPLVLGEGSQGTNISLRLVDPVFAYTLPETGGSGTTMYIVVGLVLLLTGSALLFQRRRREAVENA